MMAEKFTAEEIKNFPVYSVNHTDFSKVEHAYYMDSIQNFLSSDVDSILGQITKNGVEFDIGSLQVKAWKEEINILKQVLRDKDGYIAFEYSIPRMGKRVDAVVIVDGIVILLEFKCGETTYPLHAKNQVMNYALDLHNFQSMSEHIILYPVLVATQALSCSNTISVTNNIADVFCANASNLKEIIDVIMNSGLSANKVNGVEWLHGEYKPTPTIIEAAQALYSGHHVKEISHSSGKEDDLDNTTKEINRIIDDCKRNSYKAICFVTGVPGAGKTLVGLSIANMRHNFSEDNKEHAIYLSGNGPLVKVLQAALAWDQYNQIQLKCEECKTEAKNRAVKKKDQKPDCKKCNKGYNNITKEKCLAKTISFIQNVHNYRDEAVKNDKAPIDRIAIFDEAQRAWTKDKLVTFMANKKNHADYSMSEPECLIEYLDRHQDWACIVCLVGGGQEINDGEAGIKEWFEALNNKFNDWHVFYSDKMHGDEYLGDSEIDELMCNMRVKPQAVNGLFLSASKRSFRSEQVSAFAKAIIDGDLQESQRLYEAIKDSYPLAITRNLGKAKQWVVTHAQGTERYGIIASSKAKRLRADGINVDNELKPEKWFLTEKTNVDSSYFMELVATEFSIQGLEIDWGVLAWEGDYRYLDGEFIYKCFKGTKWQDVNNEYDRRYLKNAYRVLLTRARQGFVIYVPEGSETDETRKKSFYDGTYNYLKSIGIKEI